MCIRDRNSTNQIPELAAPFNLAPLSRSAITRTSEARRLARTLYPKCKYRRQHHCSRVPWRSLADLAKSLSSFNLQALPSEAGLRESVDNKSAQHALLQTTFIGQASDELVQAYLNKLDMKQTIQFHKRQVGGSTVPQVFVFVEIIINKTNREGHWIMRGQENIIVILFEEWLRGRLCFCHIHDS
eukprot:TRINITY_DN13948_c0_g1_i2.p1 TRINITY_DN13948_c0_g1~~TRINITY_DN13948_c0_g1_i2.p1  ORF type:complete len:185 (+),score=35.32 TRINITY_DN13948_c0_g1_i2:164-718(+)